MGFHAQTVHFNLKETNILPLRVVILLPCLNLRTYFMLILFDLDTFTYGCPVRMATSWVDAAEAGQLNEEHGTNLVCRYLSFLDNSVVNPGNLGFMLFFLFIGFLILKILI